MSSEQRVLLLPVLGLAGLVLGFIGLSWLGDGGSIHGLGTFAFMAFVAGGAVVVACFRPSPPVFAALATLAAVSWHVPRAVNVFTYCGDLCAHGWALAAAQWFVLLALPSVAHVMHRVPGTRRWLLVAMVPLLLRPWSSAAVPPQLEGFLTDGRSLMPWPVQWVLLAWAALSYLVPLKVDERVRAWVVAVGTVVLFFGCRALWSTDIRWIS